MTQTILVVEDEQALAEVLANILEYHGYAVLIAGDGQEALEIIQDNHIDLIISDYMMPRLNGIELQLRISTDPVTANTPMIMMSALPDHIEGLAVYAILKKPFAMEDFMEKVEGALQNPQP